MGEDCSSTEWYIQNGVLVEEIVPNKHDIDFHHNLGTLKVTEYNSELGMCIEWHQCDVSIESHDQEWAIVQDVKNNSQGPEAFLYDKKSSKNPIIQMKTGSLIHLEMFKKNQKLTLVGDGAKITFYFQRGNAEAFVNFLKGILGSSMHQRTTNSYVITNQNKVLEKSFAELNLFTDDHTRTTVLWNFMKRLHESPYEATMDTFCKVTNTLLYRNQYQTEEEVAELLNGSLIGDEVTDANIKISNEDYELVTKNFPLPPRMIPPRGPPLNEKQWRDFFDSSGRILDPDTVRKIIFHGGIVSKGNLRREVWKYLLDYYPWNSTTEEREDLRKAKVEEYNRMKLQWKSMSPDQAERFSAYKLRMSLIEKDVHRTDRNMDFFAGDQNPNLVMLQDILMTYVMYNFDLGYVQGMSDLLSPLLVQLGDEVDTFWCFVGFMNRVSRNFELDQEGMKEQLKHLFCLLSLVEPELANSLDQDSKNMAFCFRWLLVWFKREFTYEDIFLMWEVLWTEFVCKNYHLLMCTAILDNEKEILMTSNFGFTEILKHINELANTMNVEEILSKTEGIYLQISNASNLPATVREILGLDPVPEFQLADNKCVEEEKESVPTSKDTDNEKCLNFENDQELIFDQSLCMQYL